MRASIFVSIFLVSTLTYCADSSRKELPEREGVESHRRTDKARLEGQSIYEFDSPLKGINSREHFVMEFEFFKMPAEVTVHSHFNGFAYRDGMQVRFRLRTDKVMEVEVSSPGFPPHKMEWSNVSLTTDGRLPVRIEVHDGERSGARVLIWRQNWSPLVEAEVRRKRLTVKNADLDTQAQGWFFPTHGRGVFWGVETQGVRLSKALREAPYVQ